MTCGDDDPGMLTDDAHLDAAIAAALATLVDHGVTPDRAAIAVTDPPAARTADGSIYYATHCGGGEDYGTASLLKLAVDDVHREAGDESRALYGDERCPSCKSRRYGTQQRADRGRFRVSRFFDYCRACGFERPRDRGATDRRTP